MPRPRRISLRNLVDQPRIDEVSTNADTAKDFSTFSASEYLDLIIAENKDSKIGRMLQVLRTKIPSDISRAIDDDKRERSLVISGLPESAASMMPSQKQRELEQKVESILDI